ncbi:SAICAR synthase-like protein [Peniophora sp. CONT]|nr:SAICAR synthase-like protein [Peniophora sp. CONT]
MLSVPATSSAPSGASTPRSGAHTPLSGSITPLSSQVGGHLGVQSTADGSLIIKPSLPAEASFYQQLAADAKLADLRPFTPKFLGTLTLEERAAVERVEGKGEDEAKGVSEAYKAAEKESLVLENVSHAFARPNILDIKLGTVLYDEGATPEKRARMEETARKTTSAETGVRLTGFQVYDNNTGKPVPTGKEYGKSIKPADLPDGMRRFFPVPSSSSSQGLPAPTLLPILEGIRDIVEQLREVLSEIELRMVGGSVLIVYEGEVKRAEECMKWLEEKMEKAEQGDDDEEEDEEEEESEDEDGEEEEGKEKPKKVGSPFAVKLIDFAHTRLVPGEGPDKGVLLGLDTTLRLLNGRIEEVEKLADEQSEGEKQ